MNIFDSMKKYNSNNNIIFSNNNTQQKNIQNIKTINATRNNLIDVGGNPSSNININFKNIFEENKNIYRSNRNSQNKKLNYEQESNNVQKLDKINLKVKEINNFR